jgi:hypothetical protein
MLRSTPQHDDSDGRRSSLRRWSSRKLTKNSHSLSPPDTQHRKGISPLQLLRSTLQNDAGLEGHLGSRHQPRRLSSQKRSPGGSDASKSSQRSSRRWSSRNLDDTNPTTASHRPELAHDRSERSPGSAHRWLSRNLDANVSRTRIQSPEFSTARAAFASPLSTPSPEYLQSAYIADAQRPDSGFSTPTSGIDEQVRDTEIGLGEEARRGFSVTARAEQWLNDVQFRK